MKKIILTVIGAAFLAGIPARAQLSGFSQHAFGIGFGWYRPAMDYWNETSYVSGWDDPFDGAYNFHADARLLIASRFAVRIGIDLWEETVGQDGIWMGPGFGREDVAVQYIPFHFFCDCCAANFFYFLSDN